MAIIKCPECGNEISSSAPVCPNCGYSFLFAPTSKSRAKINLITLIVGVIFYFITRKWFIPIVIGGAIIELIVTVLTVFSSLLFGNRTVRVVLYFLVFDLGFFIGAGIGIFI